MKDNHESETDRLRLVAKMVEDFGPDWANKFRPGTSGCHELLDSTQLVSDMLERHLLMHPACVAEAEWYALAERAAAALRELYQCVGAEHLAAEDEQMKPLAQRCLYTTIHPNRLTEAAKLRGPSTFVVEQRMVTAESLFRAAQNDNEHFAVLFSDATDCSRLIYWGLLTAINVADSEAKVKDTHFAVTSLRKLHPERRTQELVLESTGERIADNFIRPYAICRTPKFLPAT